MGDADPEDEDDGQQTTPQANKERRKGRYRRGEQAGSQPPARTASARIAGTVRACGNPDQFSSCAGGCGYRRSLREHRRVEEHHSVPGDQSSQPKLPSEGADLPTANVPGADADRPRASTKRAVLIGMLERPGGASVAELGQRLGWLPHTVRAAITGLRHAGREVTRSKDAEGQSVYRLAQPETVGR